jgi:hypothetical protein
MSENGASFDINIPGIRYSARIRQSSSGEWKVAIVLGADETTVVDLKTASLGGIRTALTKALKAAEITHQVPEMVLSNLASDLSLQMQQAGVVKDENGTIGAPAEAVSETLKRISNKLNEITATIEQLELRLGRVEDRLGF